MLFNNIYGLERGWKKEPQKRGGKKPNEKKIMKSIYEKWILKIEQRKIEN
jgi:hypothetical protein